jgi:nucleotide-binding universal stress UspA family protein
MMKNILLLIHDDGGQEARFQAALDIARALGGHVTCLDVTCMRIVPGDGFGADGTLMLLEDERVRETANRTRMEARLAIENIPWDWTDVTGFLEESIENSAALADLIVVNGRLGGYGDPGARAVASSLVVKSGKPILAVPGESKGFATAGAALVAWDGSNGASAALTAAVPLLKLAASVTIVEVDDGSLSTSAEEAAAYLSRNDVHPLIVRTPRGGGAVSDILIAEARSGRFDYLVMGGFGHSRFTEAVLGGATRTMLTESPIPLFVAH